MNIIALASLSAVLSMQALAQNVCSGIELRGPYGFLLSGTTTIAGAPALAVTLGRIVFAEDGKLSGYSSVGFKGLLLGNPVTGNYTAKEDCTMELSLQDDSGAYQHFGGMVTPGGSKVEMHQTDPGTGVRGIMEQTPANCSAAGIQQRYSFSLTGASIPMESAGPSVPVSIAGTIESDGKGNFTVKQKGSGDTRTGLQTGTYEVDGDCFVRIELVPSTSDGGIKLRGIVVSEGKEILAIQTDAGETVSGRFIAR
jgi:hypothetical protein